MPTLKLRLDDLQVTSFETTDHPGTRGTVVAHDATAPGTLWAQLSCDPRVGSCGTCLTNYPDCLQETNYLTCGVTCASCAASCADPYTCDANSTCAGFPTCADTCWQTCFRCIPPAEP
jgi:hypothetical protein